MKRIDHYYYTDSNFALELNLQEIRRELIAMIEEFEQKDCGICKQLKCCCSVPTPPATKPADRDKSSQASNQVAGAPAAESLPTPKWENIERTSTPETPVNDIEIWVRAATPSAAPNIPEMTRDISKINNESAFPGVVLKSSWADEKKSSSAFICSKSSFDLISNKSTLDMIASKSSAELLNNKNAVEAFFRSFKSSSPGAQTNVSFTSSKLATAFKVTQTNCCEYTYF